MASNDREEARLIGGQVTRGQGPQPPSRQKHLAAGEVEGTQPRSRKTPGKPASGRPERRDEAADD